MADEQTNAAPPVDSSMSGSPEYQSQPVEAGNQPAQQPTTPPATVPAGSSTAASDAVMQGLSGQQTPVIPSIAAGSDTPLAPTRSDINKPPPPISLGQRIFQALSGGPNVSYQVIGGKTIPIVENKSKGQIAAALLAHAFEGFAAGAQQRGPGAGLRAAGAGFTAVMDQDKALDERNRDRAQQDYLLQQKDQLQKMQVLEANSRTILNTAEAEKFGADMLDKQIEVSKPLIEKAEEQGLLDGRGVTQQELLDGLQAGKFSPGDTLGPIDGYHTVKDANGVERMEATHAVLKNANTPVSITQEDWQRYHDAHVPGFENASQKVPGGQTVSLAAHGIYTQQAGANELAMNRISAVKAELGNDPAAKNVPTDMNAVFSMNGMSVAMQKFQRYVSHSAGNPYDALVAMGSESKTDPKTGQVTSNPDAKYANTVAQAFGGWDVLRKYNEKLKGEAENEAEMSKIPSEVAKAKAMLPIEQAKAQMEQNIKDGDPKALASMLVAGLVAPSEIVSARNSSFSSAVLKAANDQSIAAGKGPFNAQMAEAQYKYAMNPTTQNTLNMIDSMTGGKEGKGGTLDQLYAQSKALKNTQYPALNDAKAWLSLEIGQPELAGFRATLLGVSDEYSKVMGGGQGTDTARDQAMALQEKGFSPAQAQSAIQAIRGSLGARKGAMVRNNPTLVAMYGNGLTDATGVVPWSPPQGAPSAQNVPDNKYLYDSAGKPVAVARGGQWQQPTP